MEKVASRLMSLEVERIDAAIEVTREELLGRRHGDEAWWEGYLSSSAVATATAVQALAFAGFPEDRALVEDGVAWLAENQNDDGGWGDTPESPSNIAATALAVAALTAAEVSCPEALSLAGRWIEDTVDGDVVAAIKWRYGDDRTFQAPILAACALAGLVDWDEVPTLPFELASFPRWMQGMLQIRVVSYGLPALIAVGGLIYNKRGGGTPLHSIMRSLTLGRGLAMLSRLQPESGGFLEAAPLTSFVAMSLIEVLDRDHVVVEGCLEFLRETVREDGSWPIDTNLSVWLTSNSLLALRESGGIPDDLAEEAQEWLSARQMRYGHLATGAAPGGWPWTHLPGGVPDSDDTAAAVIEMVQFGEVNAARAGAVWLGGLQNSDSGWPTFCQGRGRLPFDSSSPDITAHALRAAHEVMSVRVPPEEEGYLIRLLASNLGSASRRGFNYLAATQRQDGSWLPLWFGDQRVEGEGNPVLGVARVLAAYGDCDRGDDPHARAGLDYLLGAQNEDGGWGGAEGIPSTVEQSALSVSALARFAHEEAAREALEEGALYLTRRVEDGTWTETAPIGLYFASLWYTEALYPIAWTVEALGRVREVLRSAGPQSTTISEDGGTC